MLLCDAQACDTQTIVNYSALILSFLSVLIALGSFWIAYHSLHLSARPILVFVSVENEKEKRWMIENVGNGPALEVTVYEGKSKKTWERGEKIIPIPAGTRVDSPFTYNCPKLGVKYSSILNKKYNSVCFAHETKFKKGHRKKEWKGIEVDNQKILRTRYSVISHS